MKKDYVNRGTKRRVALIALVLAVSIPFVVLAETTGQTTATSAMPLTSMAARGRMNNRSGNGYGMGSYGMGNNFMGSCAFGYFGVDTTSLTDEQKNAYDSAVALYEQVEDAVLSDLVTANVLAQADVDAYHAQRTAQKSLAGLDQTGWTAGQYKAFYEANVKTGDDRKAAMQALTDAGQLTQAQADALSAQGQSDLWTKIARNANTNSAIQTAIAILGQARKTLNNSLRSAGIAFRGNGVMNGGFGMGMMGNGQCLNGYQNDNINHMKGRMGNRN